ncbi:hypothetical protein [Geminocystis sp. GBBB08]|uniref:hypothetical protein n=1 Tax=Geminocystis sp. GBBB08 TaxID=2604140 RepID=UPI0027E29FFC|nr:hypothetical protein [Geminocystis sp. GBBB08]MBL1211438.1 hypothetical protein [Geminocystis sp. GBBB08]
MSNIVPYNYNDDNIQPTIRQEGKQIIFTAQSDSSDTDARLRDYLMTNYPDRHIVKTRNYIVRVLKRREWDNRRGLMSIGDRNSGVEEYEVINHCEIITEPRPIAESFWIKLFGL